MHRTGRHKVTRSYVKHICGIPTPVGNSGIGQEDVIIKLLDPVLSISAVFICRWEIQA
jgi:hypothetical protein